MSRQKIQSKDTCSVEGCVNPRYFSFPSDDALARKIWVDRIGDSALQKNFSICTSHFHKTCFSERKEIKRYRKGAKGLQEETMLALKRGSLPTMFLPNFKVENEEEALKLSNHKNLTLSKGEEALTRVNLQAPVLRTSLIENVCSVFGCKNTKENAVMHPFPTKNEIYSIWIERTKNSKLLVWNIWNNLWRYRICDVHFSAHCRIEGDERLKENSLPSLHMPNMHDESENASLLLHCARNTKSCPRKKKCSAPDCNTDSLLNPELNFFRFPQNFRNNQMGRYKLWRKIIWLADDNPAHFLCERHFAKHDVIDGRLKLGANPSYPTGFLNPVTNNYAPIVEYELKSDHKSAEEKPFHELNYRDQNDENYVKSENDVPIPTSSNSETFVVESINTGEHAIPAHIVFDLAIKYADHFSLASADQTKFLKRCQGFAERSGDIMEFFWKND